MSRIALTPVNLPVGVECTMEGNRVWVRGSKGKLSLEVPETLEIDIAGTTVMVRVRCSGSDLPKKLLMLRGTFKRLIANMAIGVSAGFSKTMELAGVGFRAELKGKILKMALGYSHDIEYSVPDDVEIKVEKPTIFVVSGIDKQRVGQVVSEIQRFRKPEPYKGKGVKIQGQYVRRKAGKTK